MPIVRGTGAIDADRALDEPRLSVVQRRLRAVSAPDPVLSRDRRTHLTERQREILVELATAFDEGFADYTMSGLARRLGCSLRTLYGIAPSRDELVLAVIDNNLRRLGRHAFSVITPEMSALEAIRAYLDATTIAVADTTHEFARDLATTRHGSPLQDEHCGYMVNVCAALLDLAVEQGEIAPTDTQAVARAIAGLGKEFSQPDVLSTLSSSPKEAAGLVVDAVLRGLPRP